MLKYLNGGQKYPSGSAGGGGGGTTGIQTLLLEESLLRLLWDVSESVLRQEAHSWHSIEQCVFIFCEALQCDTWVQTFQNLPVPLNVGKLIPDTLRRNPELNTLSVARPTF